MHHVSEVSSNKSEWKSTEQDGQNVREVWIFVYVLWTFDKERYQLSIQAYARKTITFKVGSDTWRSGFIISASLLFWF